MLVLANLGFTVTAQSCKPIVNFSLPTCALSAPLTYLLSALLAIFIP